MRVPHQPPLADVLGLIVPRATAALPLGVAVKRIKVVVHKNPAL